MARSSSRNSLVSSSLVSRRSRSESERTRSTTRPSRVEVERIIVPLAEIKTAGVIIAVNTASDEVKASMFEKVYSSDCRRGRPTLAPREQAQRDGLGVISRKVYEPGVLVSC